jgi:hypothetical protein
MKCCAVCSKALEKPLRCGRCGAVCYCSAHCQREHWRSGGHKQACFTKEERRERKAVKKQSTVKACALGSKSAASGCEMKSCGRCRGVYYCSTDCQRWHWPAHRDECRKVGTADDPAAAVAAFKAGRKATNVY